VHETSPEQLNGYVPNSQGRRVWFLARTSLNVKVKDQGHQGKNGVFSGYLGNRGTYLRQIPTKDVFGPSLGQV